jgi:hypothetical protein
MAANKFGGMHVPEDKNQALVKTPYGKGLVIRTGKDEANGQELMREIELVDWMRPGASTRPQRASILYSPTKFPSITPAVGSEVTTIYGRGKVVELRDDDQVVVVRISSWRLAGRSMVTCYLSPDAVQVVRPSKIYEMSIHEKVEHAQELKQEASAKFALKEYENALQLYAKAVDTVRYVQHKKDSTNELRADLLVIMITCCNNAATCCLQLHQWDRAQKFGKNGLVLLDALYEKKGNSKIHKILNREGVGDSQLFGAWTVKSYLVIAKGLAETHENQEALDNLKKALEAITMYKKEGDAKYQQLQGQEKQTRKLHIACKDRLKAERKKEKQRAMAMFGGGSEEDSDKKESNPEPVKLRQNGDTSLKAAASDTAQSDPAQKAEDTNPSRRDPPKKRVSFADGSIPGSIDDDTEPWFLDEHKEALLIVAGIAMGSALVHMLFRKGR